MREITTITDAKLTTACLGCAVASGALINYAGTIYRNDYFNAHQDIEIALPGFVIVSSIRHVNSLMDLSAKEQNNFVWVVSAIRKAQHRCGLTNVYLFQNEDTADHFHVWMFPIYEWMRAFGKGPALLSRALDELKNGRHIHDQKEVLALTAEIKSNLEFDHE